MHMDELLNSTNKRSAIVIAAINLFARKGYDGTTISDIAKAAGITQGAIYKHYPSKEALGKTIFETLINDYSTELAQILKDTSDLAQRIDATVQLTYRLYDKYPTAVCFTLKSQHNFWDSLSEPIIHPHLLFNRIVQEAMDQGQLPREDLLTLGGLFTGALMEPLTFHFYLAKEPVNMEEMAATVAQRIKRMLL